MSNNSKDGELNNNSFFRGLSDRLDKALDESYDDKSHSKTRAVTHGAYHQIQCNWTGNQRECERAKDQWNKGFGGATDNLDNYDEKTGYNKK